MLEGEPTAPGVVNVDGESCRFRIVESWLTAMAIPDNTAVDAAFTVPVATRCEGQSLAIEDEAVLATLPVAVQSAGAVEP